MSTLHDGPFTQYHGKWLGRGQELWLPAIPLPLQTMRKHCFVCKRWFWTMEGYRAHYALVHILESKA